MLLDYFKLSLQGTGVVSKTFHDDPDDTIRSGSGET